MASSAAQPGIASQPNIVLLGTCDTKLEELLFLSQEIRSFQKSNIHLIDIGRAPVQDEQITAKHEDLIDSQSFIDFSKLERGVYVKKMIPMGTAYLRRLFDTVPIHGVIAIGGSSGTSLAASIMRDSLPIGLPKILVSTMASGDISHYIGETDIIMMPSVVDIAGTNSILNRILQNAAAAISGMARAYSEQSNSQDDKNSKKRLAITMFGVTTPAVDAIRQHLDKRGDFEIYVFHATGSGGKAMERLIREGKIDAVVDLTTTEIADELFGGVLSAGPDRLKAAAERGIPQVVSVGACDMVNFGPRDSVPQKWEGRKFLEHNPAVTLMRTNKEESEKIGDCIASRLRACCNPSGTSIILPVKGISMIAGQGGPFYDPEADQSLFGAIELGLKQSKVEIIREDLEINDQRFAEIVAEKMLRLLSLDS